MMSGQERERGTPQYKHVGIPCLVNVSYFLNRLTMSLFLKPLMGRFTDFRCPPVAEIVRSLGDPSTSDDVEIIKFPKFATA